MNTFRMEAPRMDIGAVADTLPGLAVTGGGIGGGFFLLKWVVYWASGRVDKREAAVEAGTARLDEVTQRVITRLEAEVNNLIPRMTHAEKELEACRTQHAESRAEVARLKAIMQGWGEAKDHAQSILAAQSLIDRE